MSNSQKVEHTVTISSTNHSNGVKTSEKKILLYEQLCSRDRRAGEKIRGKSCPNLHLSLFLQPRKHTENATGGGRVERKRKKNHKMKGIKGKINASVGGNCNSVFPACFRLFFCSLHACVVLVLPLGQSSNLQSYHCGLFEGILQTDGKF